MEWHFEVNNFTKSPEAISYRDGAKYRARTWEDFLNNKIFIRLEKYIGGWTNAENIRDIEMDSPVDIKEMLTQFPSALDSMIVDIG